MVHVPRHPPEPEKKPVAEMAEIIAKQRAFLAEWDRQLAVLDAKKRDKNGNYEK